MSIKKFVSIDRTAIDPEPMSGIVISESDKLIMLHREVDFIFDGFVVLRKKDITGCVTGTKRQQRYEKIMRCEGVWPRISKSAKAIPITDWFKFFSYLAGRPVVVEDEENGLVWIGAVGNCGAKKVALSCFDCLGIYKDKPTSVPYGTVTSVQFNDRYSELQFKYAGEFG